MALCLLAGGVWLIVSLLPAAPKPVPAPPERAFLVPVKPPGPANLRATAKGADAVELTWEDPNGPSKAFRVERAGDRYFTKNILAAGSLSGTARTYTDTHATPGETYYYRSAPPGFGRVEPFQHGMGLPLLRAGIHAGRLGTERRRRGRRQGAAA